MYVSNPLKTKKNEISISESDKEKTNFPVKIGKTVVYWAKSSFDRQKYMNTQKYKNMVDWFDVFGPDFDGKIKQYFNKNEKESLEINKKIGRKHVKKAKDSE
jgi:hypothetical protein